MSAPLLQVRGLSCRYEQAAAPAVEQVSFEVEEGELLALVGPSGSGKSTLLRAVAGLEGAEQGEIRLRDQVLTGGAAWVPPERRGMGLVFQALALFPHLTVRENVGFGLAHLTAKEREARVQELLELVSLRGLEGRHPAQLSGGQQQRVAVARGLAPRPSLLLLDEPFSSLDAGLREELRREVRGLLKRLGTAAILVTHDREEVFAFADRVAVINAGRLEQQGRPEALYQAPASRFVAGLMGEGTLLPATAQGGVARCALGTVPLRAAASGEVWVVVRPECLRVGAAGTFEGVRARVRTKRFQGAWTRLWLDLSEGGPTLMAYVTGLSSFSEGEEVQVAASAPLSAVRS